jgi:GNAT superfamily N-acetyltransferase
MIMDKRKVNLQLNFAYLSEYPEAIPKVARWWCDEWGLPQCHKSLDDYINELASLKPGQLPIHLLALNEGSILGVATLKNQSSFHNLFPDFHYWLSGVYVLPLLRGRGIATALCLKMINIAKSKGVTRLHLSTEDLNGGLYAKIGWKAVRQVYVNDLDLLVMARDIP